MKMKALLKDIAEAFVTTFSSVKTKEVVHESKDVNFTESLLKMEESYDATSINKVLFMILHWLFLIVAVFYLGNHLVAASSFVLSSLFFTLSHNRKVSQAAKAHFIKFVLSSIRELDKTKIPGYQIRKPGIYEDNI